MATEEELRALQPTHDNLIGIDSDGCVFDSMTVKQVQCFHSTFVEQWSLQAIERPVRDCLEFVNLFSTTRGQDRFICFDLAVDRMKKRQEILDSDCALPDTADLKTWLATGGPFGNNGLEQAIAGESKAPELKDSASLQALLKWSLEVDTRVKALDIIPPFPHARTFLEQVGAASDAIVVSSTPLAALTHEWEANDIRPYIHLIASKEIGTKVQHLAMATEGGKYDKAKVLMIGDAPKDMESAHEVGVRFYPINPGKEDASWQRLHEEIYGQFLAGNYSPEREQALIDEFLGMLPEDPPWDEV